MTALDYVSGISATVHLFRVVVDLVTVASHHAKEKEATIENDNVHIPSQADANPGSTRMRLGALFGKGAQYGTFQKTPSNGDEEDQTEKETQVMGRIGFVSFTVHLLLFVYFVVGTILASKKDSPLFDSISLGCASVVTSDFLHSRDYHKRRFGYFQRVLYMISVFLLVGGFIACISCPPQLSDGTALSSPTKTDTTTLVCLLIYASLAVVEVKMYPIPKPPKGEEEKQSAKLSWKAFIFLVKPYFWPDRTASSATINRIRAMSTWIFVLCSKACSLTAPILIGKAVTAITREKYQQSMKFAILYAITRFGASTFKECQSLVYLKVGQAAFVQLSEVACNHIHSLSLDFHLRKKLGQTIRSMDRGIAACDILMKYCFLWMIPALAECIMVTVIFARYFQYVPLAVSVFFFVFVYVSWTIIVTLWRKQFRKEVAKRDNEWHDKITDSLINFETVKYFTSEEYEKKSFGQSVEKYQSGSVNVAASLSFLNVSQQVLLQTCLATGLCLAVISIQNRVNCCADLGMDPEACPADLCPGLAVGDFVSVLTYIFNLFQPLNFLGSVYSAVVMAFIDLSNLSELLAELPDVTDATNAVDLPFKNVVDDPNTVIEFDNVRFHYPTQPSSKGLKGLSFKMKRGSVTAIVGPTGEGKTTVSRLLFRFYDVIEGAIKINGLDVRSLNQKSLRSSIGVVPQNCVLFNDTLKANIKYGRQDATDEEIRKVIADAQLTTFVDSLPEGWDAKVGDRGLKLSGGEKQRCAIARCLLKDPPIVMLDEATSALDTLTEQSVNEALNRLEANRTVLVIAHRLGTIKDADNIIVLGDGTVAEEGTHDELLELDGKYAEMWKMQLQSNRGSRNNLSDVDTIVDSDSSSSEQIK